MAYFLTGATGFIGRNLTERLLAREGDIHLLVREGSEARLERIVKRWEHMYGPSVRERVHPVVGDLALPLLGVSKEQLERLRGTIEHFFHVAAVYDMTASEERNRVVNVAGTAEAVGLARSLGAGCLHHVSSIAVAGDYRGLFGEDMFDEGQRLPSPYHLTKFESERIVREQTGVPWRVYRPAVVVGDSRTGEMDKIDGPYYFFKAIQRMHRWLPEWLPLVGLDLGRTNVVPVDFVADALDHLAHRPGFDGQAFHLTAPRSQRVSEVMNDFARAAHAPHVAVSLDQRLAGGSRGLSALARLTGLPGLRDARRTLLGDFGIPEEVLEHIDLRPRFDTRETDAALAGSGIEVPPLDRYAGRLWDYWEHHLDPDRLKHSSLSAALNGRTVVITGASSGIGRTTALKVAAAGGIPLLVARSVDKLEEVRQEIEAEGGSAYVYGADLSDLDSIDSLVERLLADHAAVDMLVNNAGRSIRRSVALSYERFHDYERTIQLNYLGAVKLIMGLLPSMRARGFGHIVNISSIGVQTNPPRFSAYVASKAALDAFTRVASSEVIGDGVTFTTIHMPLVRTPMIAPTKMYDSFPAATPEEAADMVCEALRSKPKVINTRLGTFGEVLYVVAPKAVDRILHTAYRVFPDSAAARGEKDLEERASPEQIAMATLMRGVHW